MRFIADFFCCFFSLLIPSNRKIAFSFRLCVFSVRSFIFALNYYILFRLYLKYINTLTHFTPSSIRFDYKMLDRFIDLYKHDISGRIYLAHHYIKQHKRTNEIIYERVVVSSHTKILIVFHIIVIKQIMI